MRKKTRDAQPETVKAPDEKRAKNFGGSLKRLFKYMRPYRAAFALIFFFAAAGTVLSIMGPKTLGRVTTILSDSVIARSAGEDARADMSEAARVIVILFALYMASGLMAFVTSYILAGTSQKFIFQLREDIKRKLDRLPLRYFDNRTRGEVLSRVTTDVEAISSALQQSLSQIITSLVTLIGVIIIMFTISVRLTLLAMLTLPIFGVLTLTIMRRSQGYFTEQQKALGDLNGHVEDMYTGHAVVRLYNLEDDSIVKFKEINDRLFNVGWRAQFVSGVIFPTLGFVGNIGFVMICVVGGALVAQRILPIGDVQAFMQYTRNFVQPMLNAAAVTTAIQSAVAAAERIFEILDEPEEISEIQNPIGVKRLKGSVEFKNVSFRYKPETPLIENLNIDVESGKLVAIVGPTGAGKTTIVNLLMRFYEIDAGQILIDGIDITTMGKENLRREVGMALQDAWLFNGTVFENIMYGAENASEDDVMSVAAASRADHFIRALPDGYDTIIDEEASNISKGQKQLLTIARAMLAKPSIMILDEATSAVDTLTEALVQEAMETLMKGRTSFVIAHRLSTIKNADVILVMNDGAVIERGTHKDLLAAGNYYADLYSRQFAV
ncbi:MAG: ABC transporter ATP-binding protein/permease [Clostridiales bacterium]|nr:ABC transporter ATP-binding protein/permease [Clostridiales bacterium]